MNFSRKLIDAKNSLVESTKENSPEILLATGILGLIGSGVLAAYAQHVVDKHLEEAKKEAESVGMELTYSKKEFIKAYWKYYIAPVTLAVGATACLIFSNRIKDDRATALALAAGLSEKKLLDYQKRLETAVGEVKADEIKKEIEKEAVEAAATRAKEKGFSEAFVEHTGNGKVLCYDAETGRYFRSSYESICKANTELNSRLITEMWVTFNDFSDILGLTHTQTGDSLGWFADDYSFAKGVEIHIRHADEYERVNDEDMLIISYDWNLMSNKTRY